MSVDVSLYDINRMTEQIIKKYQERILPIVFMFNMMIFIAALIVSFVYFKIAGDMNLNLIHQRAEAFTHMFYYLFLFTCLTAFAFINIGYFKPESNVFKIKYNDFEAREIILITKEYTLEDYDNLFKIHEAERHKDTDDTEIKRLILLKLIYEEKLSKLIKDVPDHVRFRSEFLNKIKYDNI